MITTNNLIKVIASVSFVTAQFHPATPAHYQKLPSLRERAHIQNTWRAERIAHIPSLLQKYGVNGWLMSQREHAEDTIWWSIKNATDHDAHRRTVVMFHDNTSSLEGHPNPLLWVDNTDQIWPELRAILQAYDPQRIVINTDRDIAFGGGLHVGELEVMKDQLGELWLRRMINEPMLGVEYVATKVHSQLRYYRKMQETIWAMIEEGFSHRVIESGVTTTEDLEWWFLEKMQEQNVTTWNHPRVSVLDESSYPGWQGTHSIIEEGDILHIDFGITAMGLNTDTQHMAYVLRTQGPGTEDDVPESLKEGLKKANRMQDIVLQHMRAGLTGNDVLSMSLKQLEREGITGQIYCHPIGDWGHDAGAVIGFLNLPVYVPVLGELPILPNTYYSIELYAYHFVPERNETIRFRLEENVYWEERSETWQYVHGRQERFHLVDRRKRHTTTFMFQN